MHDFECLGLSLPSFWDQLNAAMFLDSLCESYFLLKPTLFLKEALTVHFSVSIVLVCYRWMMHSQTQRPAWQTSHAWREPSWAPLPGASYRPCSEYQENRWNLNSEWIFLEVFFPAKIGLNILMTPHVTLAITVLWARCLDGDTWFFLLWFSPLFWDMGGIVSTLPSLKMMYMASLLQLQIYTPTPTVLGTVSSSENRNE